jgi:putative membrane protein
VLTVEEERSPQDLDIDARFLLANERTLLAWVRTGLALLIAGAGVQQFGDADGRTAIAVLLAALGILCSALGGWRHYAADKALRQRRLPATGPFPGFVAVAVTLIGIGLLVAVLVD